MVNFYSIKYSGDQLSSLLDKIYNLSYSASDGILLAQVAETPEITTKQYTDGLYYWYINGEKTNVINSVGEEAELPNATAGEDGFWYLDGTQTNISIKKSTTISIDPQYNKFLNYLTKDEIETKLTDINQLIESIKESKQDLLISGDGINIDPETNTISVVGIPTKVSDLENDSDYATMNEVKEYTDSAFATKEKYTELSSANLSDLLSVGKYKIENAEDTPTSEKSGYLAVMNLNETTRQEWTTDSDFSYRDGEFSTVSSIGENNFYVNGVLQQEIPEDKIVKLQAGSKYTLSGYLNGSIEIVYPEGISSDSELTDDTELHLDNITFNSTTATKIINYPFTEKKLIIFLDKNSYNYIINKGTASSSRNEDAVIYSENDLYIEGVGGLSIESNLGNHGLKANDIVIQGNTKLKFNVVHDAIHGSQLVEIDYGEIHIDGAYDGIECKNESTNNAYVRILGGNIFISNCTHGAIGAKTSGFVCNSLTHITFDSNTKNVLDQTDELGQIIFLEDVEITGDSSISEYSFSDYFGEGGVYRATENSETGEYEFNPETDGIELVGDTYTINDEKAVILLQGFINNKRIVINGKSSDIILNKAYISYSGDAPTIYYTVDSKKLAIKTINDSLNYVIQNSIEKPSGDCDAIKSENNLQFSSNGYLIASSTFGDAADGSDFTLKSDGAKYFLNSGERGIKGTTLFIGADSDDVSEGTADNSYLSVYALGNNTGTDFADIYARNGKLTKGTYTLYNYMKGFVLCDSFKSVEGPDTILRKSVYAKTTDLISSGIEVYEDINYDKLSLRQLFKFAEWTIYSNDKIITKKLEDYALKSEIPTSNSQLTNDSNFITNAVADLVNYYKKSETYTKDEIDQRLSSIPKFNIEAVDSLPTEDISNTTIYLLKTGDESQNLYTEYIYIDDTWEKLGTQTLDLSGYATQEWVTSKNYLTNENLSGYATEDWVSSKNYITSESLNGYATEDWVNNKNYAVKTEIPTNVSQLVNDSNYQNDEQVKQLIKNNEQIINVDIECDHEYEITGKTGHEYGVAIEDSQMLLKKIQGQTNIVSKNLFLPTFTRTANSGLVLTYNKETGELNLKGTPSDDYVQLSGDLTNLKLDPNKNYVFMRDHNWAPTKMLVRLYPPNSTNSDYAFAKLGTNNDTPNDALTDDLWSYNVGRFTLGNLGLYIRLPSLDPVDITFKLAIMEGTSAEYENNLPNFDIPDMSLVNSKANLISTGRNLIKLSSNSGTSALGSVSYTSYSDGTIVLKSIKATSNGERIYIPLGTTIPAGRYSTSLFNTKTIDNPDCYIQFYYDDDTFTGSDSQYTDATYLNITNSTQTIDIQYPTSQLDIRFAENITIDGEFILTPMLVYGDNPSDAYEPYAEDSYKVNKELGAYDYIDVESNLAVEQTSDIITLDGSEDENWIEQPAQEGTNTRLFIINNVASGAYISDKVVSNTLGIADSAVWNNDKVGIGFTTNETNLNQILVRVSKTDINDSSALKSWLNSTPLQFVLKRATPTTEQSILPAGYAVYTGGLQKQVIEGKYLPYVLNKEYAVSMTAQVKANIEIDRAQQEQINELKNKNSSSGGTVVVANPSDEGTEDLTKLQVGAKVYSIPQGGGGSNLFVHKVSITADSDYPNEVPLIFINNSNEKITIDNITDMYVKSLKVYIKQIDGDNVQVVLATAFGKVGTTPFFVLADGATTMINISSVTNDEISNY